MAEILFLTDRTCLSPLAKKRNESVRFFAVGKAKPGESFASDHAEVSFVFIVLREEFPHFSFLLRFGLQVDEEWQGHEVLLGVLHVFFFVHFSLARSALADAGVRVEILSFVVATDLVATIAETARVFRQRTIRAGRRT